MVIKKMDNISDFLIISFSTALFCIGIHVFMLSYNEYDKAYEKAVEGYQNEYVVTQVASKTSDKVSYSKNQIVALLLEPLDYDIQVDSYVIKKDFHNKSKIKEYTISHGLYDKQYIYNSQGDIIKVQFNSI